MVRRVVWWVVVQALGASACTPAQAPAARRLGKVMAIGGVLGLTASTAVAHEVDTYELIAGFSVISGLGIVTYALAELSEPPKGRPPETEAQKLRRWARILSARASGAAREGNCHRVRRLERRVHLYDREVHDFVFMRDPEIVRCLEPGARPAGVRPAPEAEPVPAR